MAPASAASAGILPRTSAEPATAAWVVMAPMTTAPPSALIPDSSAMPPMSTRSDGAARRSFKVGSRVMPPATSVPSAAALSLPAASSSEDAR